MYYSILHVHILKVVDTIVNDATRRLRFVMLWLLLMIKKMMIIEVGWGLGSVRDDDDDGDDVVVFVVVTTLTI